MTEPTLDRPIERSGRALGSPLRLSIAVGPGLDGTAESERLADDAWAGVLAVFDDVDRAMSRFRDDSELTGLARRGGAPTGVSRTLVRALVAADRARRVTGGRFDPRVVDALERIGYGGASQRQTGRVGPEARPIGPEARPAGRILERAGRTGPVTLPVPVDLGGIGKGLALRWACRRVERCLGGLDDGPVAGFLLDAGGDIVARGVGSDGDPWKIGIEDPSAPQEREAHAEPLASQVSPKSSAHPESLASSELPANPEPLAVILIVGRGAVATSSTRRLRWVNNDRVLHHLIDPRTGEPGGEGLRAVTVAGPDPAWAEVWTKALFLEGERGIAAAARQRGLAAWWATEDGRFEMTAAARVRSIWVAGEA